MVDAAAVTTSVSYLIPAGAIAFSISVWGVRLPQVVVLLLPLSLVAGQAIRFPLPGQGGGLLLSDLVVGIVILSATWSSWFRRFSGKGLISNFQFLNHRIAANIILLITPFLVWSLFTLAVNAPGYSYHELAISGLYWVRLTAYLLLLPALIYVITPRLRQLLHKTILWSIATVVVLGLGQWIFFSDLTDIGGGWDPHNGRLVSTWLDPNFIGLFLVLALVWWIATQSTRMYTSAVVGGIVLLVSLMLTQSRSSVMALAGVVIIGLPLWMVQGREQISAKSLSRVFLILLSAVVLVAVVGSPLFSRLEQFVYPAFDPTVQVRLAALEGVWDLAAMHWQFGVGYNAYQFAAASEGLIGDFAIHSRAGSDNSFLTLWITTGIVGAALLLAPFMLLSVICVRRWLLYKHAPSLAVFLGLVAIFLHAQIINSALYAHILLFVALVASIALTGMDTAPTANTVKR